MLVALLQQTCRCGAINDVRRMNCCGSGKLPVRDSLTYFSSELFTRSKLKHSVALQENKSQEKFFIQPALVFSTRHLSNLILVRMLMLADMPPLLLSAGR